jgi:type IV secretion system protein TrbL
MKKLLFTGAALPFVIFTPSAVAGEGATFIDQVNARYVDSALNWIPSIQTHAESLFWMLAVISAVWTFVVLVLREGDLADFVGAAVRFIITTMFFYWLLDQGPVFANKILASTLQLANDASGMESLSYGDFAHLGIKIFMDTANAITMWNVPQGVLGAAVGILVLIALALITVNIVLVTCETWIMLSAGLVFLGFGAAEWTRELSISYFKHLLAVGIKQFVTLLLAVVALDILRSMDAAHTTSGWANLHDLAVALVSCVVLLLLISKVPTAVASICGVPIGGAALGVSTLFAGAAIGQQVANMAAGVGQAAMAGGNALGSAVRNAVRRGQSLSKGRS